jgi:hypothetical protein
MDTTFSREWQLLIAAARLQLTGMGRDVIEKALEPPVVDWNRLADLACQNEIAPLIYCTLKPLIGNGTAPAAIGRLKSAYAANAIRNSLLFRELQTVLTVLQGHKKSAIVLKGAALAETVYRDRALRPMCDVDLLIRRSDIFDVEELLNGLGYRLDEKQQRMKEWYGAHYHHFDFFKPVSPSFNLCFEIHWHLERPTRPFPVDTDGLWERAVTARIADTRALVLCPEDLLLSLCLHACKHRLVRGFRAFCDIAAVAGRFGLQMDWQQVVARASQWQMNTFAYVPLQLTEQFLGERFPESVTSGVKPVDFDDRLLKAARTWVLEERISGALFPSFFRLSHGRSIGERMAVVSKLFSRDSIVLRYGLLPESGDIRCYYPRRFIDLMVDYGAELWRFFLLGREAVVRAGDRSMLSEWLAPFCEDGTGGESP